MSDKYDPLEPLELLPDAVEGYCDLETGECVTSPLPAGKSVTADRLSLRPGEGALIRLIARSQFEIRATQDATGKWVQK